MKKVAIIGTVGVPAKYGGFETLVEHIIDKNTPSEIHYIVYCSSKSYSTRPTQYKNATLRYIPLKANGLQSIFYDALSICDAFRKADTLLILGVSGCIILPFIKLFSRKKIIVNIDGLEHQRDKWSRGVRKFLLFSERLAVRYADVIITDNQVIQDYVLFKYGVSSTLITYGGDHTQTPSSDSDAVLSEYGLVSNKYDFGLCRIEPENNVLLILEAYIENNHQLIFVGNWENSQYGRDLVAKYSGYSNIHLLSPIYNLDNLYSLRKNCRYYLHGHSAGGTNPSLVEAMFFQRPILCFDVAYNRCTTEDKALYFNSTSALRHLIDNEAENHSNKAEAVYQVAITRYRWSIIASQYEALY